MLPFDLDTKLYAVGGGLLFIIAVSFYAGYSFKDVDPSVICRPHITRISELTVQVGEIEKGIAEARATYIKESARREEAMCSAKVAEMRESYKRLRCKICGIK
ncbi:MAG: hypothetical protein VXZ72_05470 [Chlamydiota bacterium]|nr:hypothetical protein [Chlamydiota bacterium]